MKNIAVICMIYNNLPVCKEAVECAYKLARGTGQFILVNNHSLDPNVQPWLEAFSTFSNPAVDRLTILDKGMNLGCHRGFNAGYQELLPEIQYVVKLDDDTFIRTEGWDELMRKGLIKAPKVAFLSADIDPAAKQQNEWNMVEIDGLKYEQTDGGIVGFSCVMFRRVDIERWGPMRGAHEAPGDKGLYGGEEQHYANCARKDGLVVAHFPPVYCDHAKNENRHPDYPMWKWVYGYRRWTDQDMETWLKDRTEILKQYRRRLMEEIRAEPMNVDFVEYTIERLGFVGEETDSKKVLELAQRPAIAANPSLQNKFFQASARIDQRI